MRKWPLKDRVAKYEVRLTSGALRDLSLVLEWSLTAFGEQASLRYEALIRQSLKDIGAHPKRPGSRQRPEMLILGARTYHITFSRKNSTRPGVKDPRHFLVYRMHGAIVEVGRILHDSTDLKRHLPKVYRRQK